LSSSFRAAYFSATFAISSGSTPAVFVCHLAAIISIGFDSFAASEIIFALNKTSDLHADALITTEKDAVRFPRLESTPVPCYYLRVDIEITAGAENFAAAVDHICNVKARTRA
jgi:hypothetical protein